MHEPGSSTPPTAYAARWARSTYSTPRSTRPRYGPTYPARHAPTSPAQRVDVPSATGRRTQRNGPAYPAPRSTYPARHARTNPASRSTCPAPRADVSSATVHEPRSLCADIPAATGRRTQLNRSTYPAQRLGPPTATARRTQRRAPTYPAPRLGVPPQRADVPGATRRRTQRNKPSYPAPQIAPHGSPIETQHRRATDPGPRSTHHPTTRSRRLAWGVARRRLVRPVGPERGRGSRRVQLPEPAPHAVGYNVRCLGKGRQQPPHADHVVRRRRLSGSGSRHLAADRLTGMAPRRPACRREKRDRVSGIAGSP
jgi:hypothetical protein